MIDYKKYLELKELLKQYEESNCHSLNFLSQLLNEKGRDIEPIHEDGKLLMPIRDFCANTRLFRPEDFYRLLKKREKVDKINRTAKKLDLYGFACKRGKHWYIDYDAFTELYKQLEPCTT